MSMIDPAEISEAVERLHASATMTYAICSGAGAGLTSLLWSVPGCSRTLIGSDFPYDSRAFAHVIGRAPEHYTSTEAAISLASAAYLSGQRCLAESRRLETPLVGLGLTAAVSTDRARRGDDKAFLAVLSAAGVNTCSVVFDRSVLSRGEEGEIL